MEPSQFTPDAPGRLVKGMAPLEVDQVGRPLIEGAKDYWAFVPDQLPPEFVLDYPVIAQLSDADRALGELAGVGRMLSNPHLLINPFLRREAVLFSRIEGMAAPRAPFVCRAVVRRALPSVGLQHSPRTRARDLSARPRRPARRRAYGIQPRPSTIWRADRGVGAYRDTPMRIGLSPLRSDSPTG